MLTFFPMFVIMSVATDTRAVGEAAAIAIGGTVGLDAMFGGPISGASMNPARSLGPAIATGTMGCGDACPIYPGNRYEDWEVNDPAGRDLDGALDPRRHRPARRRAPADPRSRASRHLSVARRVRALKPARRCPAVALG